MGAERRRSGGARPPRGRLARCGDPRPASFYCHFLSSPDFDEVELAVRDAAARPPFGVDLRPG